MAIYEQSIQLVNPMTLDEKVLLLEHLQTALRRDIEPEAYKNMLREQTIP